MKKKTTPQLLGRESKALQKTAQQTLLHITARKGFIFPLTNASEKTKSCEYLLHSWWHLRNLFLSTEIVLLGHKWFNLQLFKQDPSVSSFPKLFN